MTIPSAPASISYAGDGTTTIFALPFVFFGATELEVIERDGTTGLDVMKTLGADYSVGGGGGAVGTVTATTAPPVGKVWTIRRATRREQLTDYQADGAASLETLELLADRIVAISQEQDDVLGRALRGPPGDAPISPLPGAALRAGKVAAYDSLGNPTTIAVSGSTIIEHAQWAGTASGSANAITLSPTPAVPALGAGLGLEFIAAATNTSTATLNVSGLGARPLARPNGTPLQASDIVNGSLVSVRYDGASFRLTSLQASVAAASESAPGIVERSTQAEVNAGSDATGYVSPATLRNERRATSLQSSGYTVVSADNGRLIRCSGTFVLALTAAATLGDGFRCRVRNVGSGTITIDPAGAELINGGATLALGPGVGIYLDCDGTGWHTIGDTGNTGRRLLRIIRVTSSQSYTPGAGTTALRITAVGGGGGGGRGGAVVIYDTGGGGGGSGGTCFPPDTPVLLADGTWIPIDRVQPGMLLMGRGGETNKVIALDVSALGGRPMWRINGHHLTTAEHRHLTTHGWASIDPQSTQDEHMQMFPVVYEGGRVEARQLVKFTQTPVRPLVVGDVLIRHDGTEEEISTLEAEGWWPGSLNVHSLVMAGSHTFVAGGFIVSGWARDDDFDYAAWRAR